MNSWCVQRCFLKVAFFALLCGVVTCIHRAEAESTATDFVEIDFAGELRSAYAVVLDSQLAEKSSKVQRGSGSRATPEGRMRRVDIQRLGQNRLRFAVALLPQDRREGVSFVVFATTISGKMISSAVMSVLKRQERVVPNAVLCVNDPKVLDLTALQSFTLEELEQITKTRRENVERMKRTLRRVLDEATIEKIRGLEQRYGIVGSRPFSSDLPLEEMLRRIVALNSVATK